MSGSTAITLDIDWAPDWVVDEVAAILVNERTKATWFVTHQSPALDRLRRRPDLFELGLHPNFLPDSTHGGTEDEVLQHMRGLLPEAVSMRAHSLHQNSRLLAKAAHYYGVQIDASLLLPAAEHLSAHSLHLPGASLQRVPSFWEDDVELYSTSPHWEADDPQLNGPGLRVFNFHPIHVILNTNSPDVWERCKRLRPLHNWVPEFLQEHRCEGPGPGTLFRQLASRLHGTGRTISEIAFEREQPCS